MAAVNFNDDIAAFYAESVRLAADGLTIEEATTIISRFVSLCVRSAFSLSNPGPEKKAIVMDWITKLIDKISPALPAPYNWIVWFARAAVLKALSAWVESKYEELKAGAAALPPALPPASIVSK